MRKLIKIHFTLCVIVLTSGLARGQIVPDKVIFEVTESPAASQA